MRTYCVSVHYRSNHEHPDSPVPSRCQPNNQTHFCDQKAKSHDIRKKACVSARSGVLLSTRTASRTLSPGGGYAISCGLYATDANASSRSSLSSKRSRVLGLKSETALSPFWVSGKARVPCRYKASTRPNGHVSSLMSETVSKMDSRPMVYHEATLTTAIVATDRAAITANLPIITEWRSAHNLS